MQHDFRRCAEGVLQWCGTTAGELLKWCGSSEDPFLRRRQPRPARMRGPQVQRPHGHHRLGRERVQRPAGEPHPLEVLPVPLEYVPRALVLERLDQVDLDESLDVRRDLPGGPLAQRVVRRLERHHVGPHHPEVVGCQQVRRPHPERQVRQSRHLRRVAQPRVEQPVRGHGYLPSPADPLGGSHRHSLPHPAPRSIADPHPGTCVLVSTSGPDRTRRTAPSPAARRAPAPSRSVGPASTLRPPASTSGR